MIFLDPAPKSSTATVWSLSANDIMDDDVELMDSDDLLDDADLLKPDPASLKGGCSLPQTHQAPALPLPPNFRIYVFALLIDSEI